MIGCTCETCLSLDERNHRWRSSVYLTIGNKNILIDTSPDFREQAIKYRIFRTDAILLTHAHVDHLFGLDDIRRLNTLQDASIPLYGSPESIEDVKRIFDYIFKESILGTYRPKIDLHAISSFLEFDDGNGYFFKIMPLEVVHGLGRTFGYRFDYMDKSLAYIPDCHEIPASTIGLLNGLDVLIIDTLRYRIHPTHLSLDESLSLMKIIAPKKAYLTHIGHDLEHCTLEAELKERCFDSVSVAYDGLTIDLL